MPEPDAKANLRDYLQGATGELQYFGAVFGRPHAVPLPEAGG